MIAPKLRFSEFKDEWNESNVGSLISNSSEKFNPLKETVNLPCVELEHLSQGTGEIIGYCSSVKQKSIKNKFNEKNVLFGKLRPYLKKYAKPNFKGVCSSEIWVLSSQRLNTNFLFQYIQTRAFLDLTLIQSGSKMPRAEWEMVADGTIFYPQEKEQTKIAEFLSAVDDKISQLSRQLELLNQYKKGVMQKIFSQEIRFKNDNGEDFGEWEEVKFSDIFIEIKDKVGNKNIETYSITAGKGFVSQSEKFGRDISGSQNENYIVLGKNDFSYNKGNSKTYKFGCVYLNNTGQNIAVPNVFISFRAKKNNIAHNFYAKLFEHHYLDRYLRQLISSSARMDGLLNISKEGFFEIPLPFPPTPEQEKIAEFLTAIDERIDHTTAQLTQTKQWKKGLLQQMFV